MENGSSDVINTVGFNHNGQLVVTGDVGGMIKVYGRELMFCLSRLFKQQWQQSLIYPLFSFPSDIRSLTRIMEWSASSQPILSCTFSFDETSIFSVDSSGHLSQDSVHKPGKRIDTYPLQGFTTSTLSSAMMATTSSSASIRSIGGSSIRSKSFLRTTSSGGSVHSANIPRIQLEGTGGAVGTAAVDTSSSSGDATTVGSTSASTNALEANTASSSNSTKQGNSSAKDATTSTLTRMNIGPGQLLSWSGDTDHVVMGCGNAGVIVQVRCLDQTFHSFSFGR